MPLIKPFRAICPSPALADKVALQVESLSLEEAKAIREKNPYSYINLLVPEVRSRFGRGSKKELAFKKINENLEEFLENGTLIRSEKAGIYVYRVSEKGQSHTGIWTVTSIDDYLHNRIKRHELTRQDREQALVDYLRQTGIDGNPVLITYPPDAQIEEVLENVTVFAPVLRFENEGITHSVWQIGDEDTNGALTRAFSGLERTYIADGHHRAAAACSYAIERRKANFKHRGDEEYNFFSSVYMSYGQLRIVAFHRLVRDLNGLNENEFMEQVAARFSIKALKTGALPAARGEFILYTAGGWYRLLPETVPPPEIPVDSLDVSILQEQLLGPVLAIRDPRTDQRLHFTGGDTCPAELKEKVDSGEFAAAFLLYPTAIGELIGVADAGEVMPPKSTWFEPKFQAGLLVHVID